MTKVNIREALNQIDKDTDCKYDLVTLYEACNLTEDDKKDIAKMVADKEDADVIYDKLTDKYGNDISFDDDSTDDLKFIDMSKEAYLHGGDDYGFDEYDFIDHYDDLEEGILNPYDNIIDEIIMDNVDKIKQGWIFDDFFNKVLEDFKKIAEPEEDDIEILKDKAYKQYRSLKRLYDKNDENVQETVTKKEINNKVNEHYYSSAEEFKKELTDDLIKKAFTPEQAEWLVNKRPTDAEWLAYGNAGTDDFEYFISYTNKHLNEDTVKTSKGKWVNKGKEGTHGTFDTKKEADAQRKAMFASGWKGESLSESINLGDKVNYHGEQYVIIDDSDDDLLVLRPLDRFKEADFNDIDSGDNSEDIYLAPYQLLNNESLKETEEDSLRDTLFTEYQSKYTPDTHDTIYNEIKDKYKDETLATQVVSSLENDYKSWFDESLNEEFKTYYISYKESEGKFKDKYVDLPIRATSKEEAEEKFLKDHPNIKSYDYKVISQESLTDSVNNDTKELFRQAARDKVFSTHIYNHYPFSGAIELMDEVDENGEGRKLKFTSRDEMNSKADELLDNGYISYTYKRSQDESVKESNKETLIEASYGGAYDIADDEYFTKDDGMEAVAEILSIIRKNIPDKEFPDIELGLSDMDLNNRMFRVTLTDEDENEFTEEVQIDMRKIRHPLDLIKKYVPTLAEKFIKQINDYYKDYYSEI